MALQAVAAEPLTGVGGELPLRRSRTGWSRWVGYIRRRVVLDPGPSGIQFLLQDYLPSLKCLPLRLSIQMIEPIPVIITVDSEFYHRRLCL